MAKNSIKVYKTQMKAKITKAFSKEIAAIDIDLMRVVDNKLYRTYKENLIASYDPRSDTGKAIKDYNEDEFTTHRKKVSYRHTGILARSVDTIIEGNTTRITIKDDEVYDNGKKPSEIIEILKNGSSGGGSYLYKKEGSTVTIKGQKFENTGIAYNYPTSKHKVNGEPFEEHTRNIMNEFCDQLADFMRRELSTNKKVTKHTPAKFRIMFKNKYGVLMRKRY